MQEDQRGKYYKGAVLTKCPYYCNESDRHITCEGYTLNTLESTHFKSEADKQQFQQDYCFDPNRYRDCSQCILLDAKYKLIERGLRKEEEPCSNQRAKPSANE